ncbi:MAG TPA: ABC transporter permease [Mucilaginibacter sp.]|jgi:putative ABC transport system permease protein|nr:ABC transporter permease [Mucilaginibacter sp.]
MFKNYLTSAFRSLKRFRLFTLLNIFGLATGMACSILIFLWVQDERSYDKFNDAPAQLFRVTANVAGIQAAVTPLPVAVAAKQQIPAIKNFARLVSLHSIVTIGIKKFDEKNMFYADPAFLQMFNYPLLHGNKENALSRPDGAVITSATALKYFGLENPVGKILHIDDDVNGNNYVVTGVLQNIPHNSHLQFDVLLPIITYEKSSNYSYNNPSEWGNFEGYTYFQLNSHTKTTTATLHAYEKQIDAIHTANDPMHTKASFTLQPIADIHLHSNLMLDVDGQGNSQYVTIFSLVAAFILLIACINFMNLSTALAGQRAKEVGLRKTLGAARLQLIIQFMSESFLVTFASMFVGLAIAWLLLPLFNDLSGKTISVDLLDIKIISALIGIAALVGVISGSYPAFFLSSFKPVKVLKGLKIFGGQNTFLRNSLVIFQFAIAVVLMVSTLVVNNQLKFIRNRDIGYNKENLLYLQMPQSGDLQSNYQALKATLNQNSRITNYTLIEHLPTYLTTGTTDLKWAGKDPRQQTVFPHIGADGNFLKTFGIRLAAGRGFDDNNKGDAANYILNETAAKFMGFTAETAIGQKISMNGNPGEVIGVVKDFNFKPVKQTIEPLVLRYTKQGGFVVIRTSPANIQQIIGKLKTAFQNVYPNFPFSYGFVDQDLSKLYVAEQQMGKLFNVFSVISIIVSCLGLFGLATFATQKRLKEIGVRRVLGASTAGIVTMLAKDFVKLVALALFVAFPVAWWAMNKWLENYVYRIQMSWWMFAATGITAIVIAFLTISYQSIKAAGTNPVDSLRTE